MIPTDNAATACFLIPNFGQFCHANCCLNMEYIKLVEMFTIVHDTVGEGNCVWPGACRVDHEIHEFIKIDRIVITIKARGIIYLLMWENARWIVSQYSKHCK